MQYDRENPSPLASLPGCADATWHEWSPEMETAYLQQIAGVERLEDATSLQLVVNTAASGGGTIAHLGGVLPNLLELNLSGSTLDSLRDLGTGFRLLQVLWVSRCGLKDLDGLNGLSALRELYAAYNDIADLQPVDSCPHLELLDVEGNCIEDVDSVHYLTSCTSLQTLTLSGNPAASVPNYRRTVCSVLPSLTCLDDEPVTPTDYAPSPSRSSRDVKSPLLPTPLKAHAATAATENTSASSSNPQQAAATIASDAEEVALVVAGIKHARVGVDSHEFHEIEMNLLVAAADGTDVQLDLRSGTSPLLPASASTWVRTLRSSREGSLAALRTSSAIAGGSGGGGSQSPASACSASPISSRPPSAPQPPQHRGMGSEPPPPPGAQRPERWAVPAGPGICSVSSGGAGSYLSGGTPPAAASTRRPSSGAGGYPSGGGAVPDSPMRPGSGGCCRPGTGPNRPFSARPGTAASFSARIGTSASAGTAPSSASSAIGLYWSKMRISTGAAGEGGAGSRPDGAGPNSGGSGTDVDSKLTRGSDTTFGGSFAKDLRKWKGAAVRAAAAAMAAESSSSGGGDVTNGAASTRAAGAAVTDGGLMPGERGLSLTLRRGGQLDPKALLEELKQWKLETADKVLFVDPDESASPSGWAAAGEDGSDGGGSGLGALTGAVSDAAGASPKADILRLNGGMSQDGTVGGMDFGGLGAAQHSGEQDGVEFGAAGGGGSPGTRQEMAAGRRKMVLDKVLRDVAADNVGGVIISEILSRLRPMSYGKEGAANGVVLAWPEQSSPKLKNQHPVASSALNQRGHHASATGTAHYGGGGGGNLPRASSARSVCSSASGQSEYGSATGGLFSRPVSRDEGLGPAAGTGGISSSGGGGGAPLQRQRSATRAPGLPAGPSAPSGAYRLTSVAGEVDVRTANPMPVLRPGGVG